MNTFSYFVVFIACLFSVNSYANWQISTNGSSSSSSRSQTYKISETFFENHKLTLSQSSGYLTADTADKNSSSFKLSYRYKIDNDLKLTLQLNQMDEYNLFTSQGLGFKIQKNIPITNYKSSLSIGIDTSDKKYSTYSQLTMGQRQITLSFDQDLSENLNWSLSYTTSQYETKSQVIQRRLNGSTILFSEIDSYISGLPVSSTSFGIDYVYEDLTTSFSLSSDRTDPATPSRSTGQSVSFDYSFTENFEIGLGVSRSKEIGATTISQSTSWSLSYLFP